MSRKALVTGADGFIGSHLTESLVEEGYEVRALAMYNALGDRGWLEHLPDEVLVDVEVVLGDIRDPACVRELVSDREVVFHLAALIGIPYSYRAADSYLETNARGTLNILQGAKDASVGRVIHTSTSEVYGSAQTVPIREDHPLQGQSPYSASKIAADQLAHSFFASFGLPVVTVRPFNTYGPRQSARAVIPTIITQLASGEATLKLGSLHPTRDFTYVADTVRAFLAADRASGIEGEVINLGTGYEIAIGRLAEVISDLMGVDIDIRQEQARVRPEDSEVDRLVADNAKAEELMAWSPEAIGEEGLRQGLERTISWFTAGENLRRYRPGEYTV